MDKATVTVIIIVACIVSFIIGYVARKVYDCRTPPIETYGTLRIDRSDPDGPYLFLELDQDPEPISRMETVTFKVNPVSYISDNKVYEQSSAQE